MADKLALQGGSPVRTKPFHPWPVFGKEEETYLMRALKSGAWGKLQGTEVTTFEKRFAEYHQCKHAYAVVNGTVAIRIALMAAGVQAGDEVIVPPYTFIATASAVLETNATPVFADLQLDTFNIDPVAIEAAITPRTRAIVCVHLGGLPCDMDKIMGIAKKHNLIVIEDACHAHGAEYKGRRCGSLGHMAAYSFQSSKNVSSGEGGIILTNDDRLGELCWSIHNCGRVPGGAWYEHHRLGGNYRLGEFQGAVLNAQWDRFEGQAKQREENGKYLDKKLSAIPGIIPQKRTADCTRHAYQLYSFRIEPEKFGIPRGVFLKALQAEGVPCSPGYLISLYRQKAFLDQAFGPYNGAKLSHPNLDYSKCNCPNCETISCVQGVWIEQRIMLGPRQDMDDIIAAITKIHENRKQVV